MADITYCINTSCPIKSCYRHYTKLKELTSKYVSIADFGGTCERYLRYVLEEIEKEERK